MVDRQTVERLREAAGPSDGRPYSTLILTDAEEEFFCMLGQKSRPRLQILCLAKGSGFDGDCGTDCIAVALVSSQTQSDRIADSIHRQAQDTDLRRRAILQNDPQPAIAIEVGERKCAAVIAKIQSHHAGDVGKCAIAIVCEKDISLVTVPG